MKIVHVIAFALVIIGALNIGLVELFKLNLVEAILGGLGLVSIANILIGISAVYIGATHMKDCKVCSAK